MYKVFRGNFRSNNSIDEVVEKISKMRGEIVEVLKYESDYIFTLLVKLPDTLEK